MVGVRRDGLDRLAIAAPLVRDHGTRFAIGCNQSTKKKLCDFGVAARLDQNVECDQKE